MKSNLVHRFHGENGITYSIFSALKTPAELRRFINTARWESPSLFPDKFASCEIHLFPSFGRRWGLGEPDALIVTPDAIIYVEVETEQVSELGRHFCKQLSNFAELSHTILAKSGQRLRGKLQSLDGRKVRGLYRTRKLLDILQSKSRESFFLIIAEGRGDSREDLLRKLENCKPKLKIGPEQVGWLSLSSIARMKWLPPQVLNAMTWNRRK